MQYTKRQSTVEARQHLGLKLTVSSHLKGEQVAENGDFLVVDPAAVKQLRDRERAEGLADGALGNRQTVYVVPKAEFLREFDADDASAPDITKEFNVPDGLDVNAGLAGAQTKSSGDGLDAGDWTEAGDGTAYPSQAVFAQRRTTTIYPKPLITDPNVEVAGATAPVLPGHGEVLTPSPDGDLREPAVPEVKTEEV